MKKSVKKNNDKWKQHLKLLIKKIIEKVCSESNLHSIYLICFISIEPIPIVLMNEDDIPEDEEAEDGASDRTLVAENEEENPSPEYRLATVTPSANTVPIAEELHEDEEATLADPTIMTLQTPLPEQQVIKQQQNLQHLMAKIERQRKAAQNRSNQQAALVTPTIKTPKRVIVSPGYIESSTSIESGSTQQENQEEQSTASTTTAEIEERRAKLEFVLLSIYFDRNFFRLCRARKQALEEQILLLSARANLIPQKTTCTVASSSSDISIESLLKNLRTTNNTASVPSASSSIYAGKHHENDHEQFAQAVQAIVTSDESQLQSSSSGIAIEDDDRSHGTASDDTNKGRFLFDKYESHSADDRDQSLEDLITRLVTIQQQSNQRQCQSKSFLEDFKI